jgi:N-acetylglucosamine malate deacetylase 2
MAAVHASVSRSADTPQPDLCDADSGGGSWLERFATGALVAQPVALIAAHPDDETLWIGTRLKHLQRLRLIHITDGAPRDLQDARRAGYATAAQYAQARAVELERALHALEARPEYCRSYAVPDQESAHALVAITGKLRTELAGVRVVLTHPYEHGHPDHDSAAFAVHAARALLVRSGLPPPEVVEFCCYHRQHGKCVSGTFWPAAQVQQRRVRATEQDRQRKDRALCCFRSQRDVIAELAAEHESLRIAPAYDFAGPAPPGEALYDAFGWRVNSISWRESCRAALQALGLSGPL